MFESTSELQVYIPACEVWTGLNINFTEVSIPFVTCEETDGFSPLTGNPFLPIQVNCAGLSLVTVQVTLKFSPAVGESADDSIDKFFSNPAQLNVISTCDYGFHYNPIVHTFYEQIYCFLILLQTNCHSAGEHCSIQCCTVGM